jgi:hypothetical protein
MYVTGTVVQIGEKENPAGNLIKRVVKVVPNGVHHSQRWPLDFLNDRAKLVDELTVGDEIVAWYNVHCSTWENASGQMKDFISFRPYKVQVITKAKENGEVFEMVKGN